MRIANVHEPLNMRESSDVPALVLQSCFLLYTALVTPVILCFYSNTPPCWKNPFLDFDMVLDSFFLFEILVTFFVGVYSDGRYIDRWPLVVERYFKSGALLFDAVTSVPVSYLEFAAIQVQHAVGVYIISGPDLLSNRSSGREW